MEASSSDVICDSKSSNTSDNCIINFKCKNKNCANATNKYMYENGYYYCVKCGQSQEAEEEEVLVSPDIYHTSFISYDKSKPALSIQVPRTIQEHHKTTVSNISRGQKRGWYKILYLSQAYNASEEMKNNAISVFNSVYPTILNKSISLKETVASCCLYKVLETYDFSVLMNEFIRDNILNVRLFYKALKLVESKFDNAPSQDNMIRAIFKQGSIYKIEKFEDLVEITAKILNLAERCWLYSGRSPSATVIACSYYAYRFHLMNTNVIHWSKVDSKEFCERFKIDKTPAVNKRINELTSLILTLAQNSINPMYNGNKLTKRDIETHLEYVLMFSDTLIKDFLKSKTEDSIHDEVLVLESFRKGCKSTDVKCENNSVLTDECAKHLNELSDENLIKDDEMAEYIRSPEEVSMYEKLQLHAMENIPLVNQDYKSILFHGLPKYTKDADNVEKLANLIKEEDSDE